jgi:hypothetical protein
MVVLLGQPEIIYLVFEHFPLTVLYVNKLFLLTEKYQDKIGAFSMKVLTKFASKLENIILISILTIIVYFRFICYNFLTLN